MIVLSDYNVSLNLRVFYTESVSGAISLSEFWTVLFQEL